MKIDVQELGETCKGSINSSRWEPRFHKEGGHFQNAEQIKQTAARTIKMHLLYSNTFTEPYAKYHKVPLNH